MELNRGNPGDPKVTEAISETLWQTPPEEWLALLPT